MLSVAEWSIERTALAAALTGLLAPTLAWGASLVLGTSVRLDGLVIDARGVRQPITVSCFGLIAIVGYLSALVGTPASWPARWRGVCWGVPWLVLANALRILVLWLALAVWPGGFGLVHVLLLGVGAPLAVTALWGWWLRRETGALPRIPWRFVRGIAVSLAPAGLVWWILLRPYLQSVLAVALVVLAAAGVPVERADLADAGLAQYLSVMVPEGTARLEAVTRSLCLVPFLALAAATPVAWRRRIALSLVGIAASVVAQGLESGILIVFGLNAPSFVGPAESVSTFLTLATGPLLWVLFFDPSRAWWEEQERIRAR